MSQLMLTAVCRLSATTGRLVVRQVPSRCASSATTAASTQTFEREAAKFMQRHAQRGSPLSPYMIGTTYKPQLTSMLSITHRITGLGLGILIYGIGLAEAITAKLNFEQILSVVKDTVPEVLITGVKVLTGTSIAFHVINGVRHLAWDAGYGFKIAHLYKSGYAVIGLTLVAYAFLLKGAFE